MGSGFQWYSWIHINDLVRAILFTIDNPKAKVHSIWLHQLLNAKIYLGTLARVMHRPHETWVPSFLMRLALGEMSTVVLDTQKVLPNKLDALGFTFNYLI